MNNSVFDIQKIDFGKVEANSTHPISFRLISEVQLVSLMASCGCTDINKNGDEIIGSIKFDIEPENKGIAVKQSIITVKYKDNGVDYLEELIVTGYVEKNS